MNMFASVLARMPRNRSDLLTELEYPDNITLSPYLYQDYEPSLEDETESSMSSIALSRTMIDTDIEFKSYRKSKTGTYDDPWQLMKESLDAFPQDYLDSLRSFYTPSEVVEEPRYARDRDQYIEDLVLRMVRFFEEECRVFGPDDPGLVALEKAIDELDLREDEQMKRPMAFWRVIVHYGHRTRKVTSALPYGRISMDAFTTRQSGPVDSDSESSSY